MPKTERLIYTHPASPVNVLKAGEVIATVSAEFNVYRAYSAGDEPGLVTWNGRFVRHRDKLDVFPLVGEKDVAIQVPGVALVAAIQVNDIGGSFSGDGTPPLSQPEGD